MLSAGDMTSYVVLAFGVAGRGAHVIPTDISRISGPSLMWYIYFIRSALSSASSCMLNKCVNAVSE